MRRGEGNGSLILKYFFGNVRLSKWSQITWLQQAQINGLSPINVAEDVMKDWQFHKLNNLEKKGGGEWLCQYQLKQWKQIHISDWESRLQTRLSLLVYVFRGMLSWFDDMGSLQSFLYLHGQGAETKDSIGCQQYYPSKYFRLSLDGSAQSLWWVSLMYTERLPVSRFWLCAVLSADTTQPPNSIYIGPSVRASDLVVQSIVLNLARWEQGTGRQVFLGSASGFPDCMTWGKSLNPSPHLQNSSGAAWVISSGQGLLASLQVPVLKRVRFELVPWRWKTKPSPLARSFPQTSPLSFPTPSLAIHTVFLMHHHLAQREMPECTDAFSCTPQIPTCIAASCWIGRKKM